MTLGGTGGGRGRFKVVLPQPVHEICSLSPLRQGCVGAGCPSQEGGPLSSALSSFMLLEGRSAMPLAHAISSFQKQAL